MTTEWVTQWNDVISAAAEMPGVWRRKAGGFRVRGRVVDPKTGKLRGVNRIVECSKAREAAAALQAELDAIRSSAATTPTARNRTRFDEWALDVFDRKVKSGAILSARGRDKWHWCLSTHLIPAFGSYFVDAISREQIERWKTDVLLAPRAKTKDAKRDRALAGDRYSPETVNTILGVLRQVMGDAAETFNFNDPSAKVENVSKRGHRTYTYEEPNALKLEDLGRFLDEFRVRHPEHYAFVYLGFMTGQRPSSLRPLRRSGPSSDVKWDDRKILVRRSHTRRRSG